VDTVADEMEIMQEAGVEFGSTGQVEPDEDDANQDPEDDQDK